MPESPHNIAVPLDGAIDALSDVLEMIHLRGGEVVLGSAGRGETVRFPQNARVLHVVTVGSLVLEVDGEGSGRSGKQRVKLCEGDLALLATGREHRLRADGPAGWISGAFLVEENAARPVLQVLPPAIVIGDTDKELDWLPLSAHLLAVEVDTPSPGSQVMVSRILDLLFIQALRAWAAQGGPLAPGWLTAALDRSLGPSLKAMHGKPEVPWSVNELADLASMSRAAFSSQFARLMGEPPGRYLARLRLARAADAIVSTSDSIGSIGRAFGYASEAGFSRAFSREYGASPRAWRQTGGR